MKNLALIFLVVSCFAIVVSCTYNKKELPAPIEDPIVTPSPEPTPVVPSITYTSHVKSMMDNNCIQCHGHMGGVTLETYTQVKAQADAGRILARAINGASDPNGPMPPLSIGGLMPQTTLDTLQIWLDQGALE